MFEPEFPRTHSLRLINAFEHHFASHLIGKIKPDEEAFRHVTDALGLSLKRCCSSTTTS